MTRPSGPLRIGLLGAGFVSGHHLAAWRRHAPRAQVLAIADPHLERAADRARSFGVPRVYTSAEALIEAGDLDAIDIASQRETHPSLVRLAMSRGLAVLCQKPLAPTYEEAVALVRDVRGKARLMVHENWRFRPWYRQIGEWLRAGRIGNVVQAQMTLLSSGLLPDTRDVLPAVQRQPFLADLERALVMEFAIHHIDTLRFLLGDLELMHARLGKACTRTRGEDRVAAAFETEDGTPVGLLANLCVHGEPAATVDRLLLVGERGSIRLDGGTLSCEGEHPARLEYDLDASYADSYTGAIGHFIDALASGAEFETGPDDNLRTLQLVEEIYRRAGPAAGAGGRPVRVAGGAR